MRALLPLSFLFFACSNNAGGSNTPVDSGAGSAPAPKNGGYCTDPAPSGCTTNNICGVCVPTPPAELVRTTAAKEYTGSGPADVSCFDTKNQKPLGTPKMVTMQGLVKIFANGPDSKNVKIEVYKEELDASGKPQGKLGALVGTTVSDDTAMPTIETIMKSGMPIDRALYPYKLDGVPTETPLIVKTSGKTDADLWFPLYDWNIVARNDALEADGTFKFGPRALGNDDYASIMKAAYNRPAEAGKSALAGEVHDCGDVRLSNATVETNPKSSLGLFYLSEVEDDPKPDIARKGTGRLGLYAVGGLMPAVYSVGSAGLLGGETVSLGSYKVQTFPDSVSVFTFRGLRPWQVSK
ncbi:MAG: hypothetical protein ACXVEF_08285 [Polyangiales bacterium]